MSSFTLSIDHADVNANESQLKFDSLQSTGTEERKTSEPTQQQPQQQPAIIRKRLSVSISTSTAANTQNANKSNSPPSPTNAASSSSASSMFTLLGVLNNYRSCIRCSTLDQVFLKLNLDERTWRLLVRSQLPKHELSAGVEQLLETVTEFVKRLHRKSPATRIPTILDQVIYTEEVNFAYRVYSRSNTLFGSIQRWIKLLVVQVENYCETSGVHGQRSGSRGGSGAGGRKSDPVTTAASADTATATAPSASTSSSSSKPIFPRFDLKSMYSDLITDLEAIYTARDEKEREELREVEEKLLQSKMASKRGSASGVSMLSQQQPSQLSQLQSQQQPHPPSSPSPPSARPFPSQAAQLPTGTPQSRSRRTSSHSMSHSHRGSIYTMKEEVRKKAALAAAITSSAVSAAAAVAKSDSASSSTSTSMRTSIIATNFLSAASSTNGSARASTSNYLSLATLKQDERRDSTMFTGDVASSLSSPGSTSLPLSSRASISLVPITSATDEDFTLPIPSHEAAALAAQAFAAVSSATEAAERAVEARILEGEDSEEDDVGKSQYGSNGGNGASSNTITCDDIFRRLIEAKETHQYPLPKRNRNETKRKKKSSVTSDATARTDFLTSYLPHYEHSFDLIEQLLDWYLLGVMTHLVTLSLTEILKKHELFQGIMNELNAFLSGFIRDSGLPIFEKLLSHLEKRFMKENILPLSFNGIEYGRVFSTPRQIIRKIRCLHNLCTSIDIYLLPKQIDVHQYGCKYFETTKRIGRVNGNQHQQHANDTTNISSYLLTCGYDKIARIWDISASSSSSSSSSSPGKCLAQFVGHTSIITWCAFTSNDAFVITASYDNTIRIWNSATAMCERMLTGHTDSILCGDVSTKDKYIISGSMDCTVRLWSFHTGKCLRIYTGHRHWIKSVKFISAGDEGTAAFISAALDKTIMVWGNMKSSNVGGNGADSNSTAAAVSSSSSSGSGPKHILQHSNYILDLLIISSDSFLSTSKDETLRVWNLNTGREECRLANPNQSAAVTLCLSPDSTLIAAGFFDNTINIYDAAAITKDYELKRVLKVHNDGILCLKWLSNRSIAVGTSTGALQILQV